MAERRCPRPDADFAAYMNNYYAAAAKFWSVQGFAESELKPFKEALSVWSAAFPAHVKAAAEAGGRGRVRMRPVARSKPRPGPSPRS